MFNEAQSPRHQVHFWWDNVSLSLVLRVAVACSTVLMLLLRAIDEPVGAELFRPNPS